MARRKSVPKYCLHKPSGQAVVYVDRKAIYLGAYNSSESQLAYSEVLGRIASRSAPEMIADKAAKQSVSVAELCLKFVSDELPRYSPAEQHCQRAVLRLLRQLFGATSASDFGPLRLRVLRQAMIDGDPDLKDRAGKPKPRNPWSRNTVNRQVKRVRAIFRWGVSWEMVTTSVVDALDTVSSLTEGETTAAESIPRVPVSDVAFHAVRRVLREKHRDMLDLLSLTGARPGELLKLTTGIIDRSGPVWRCELAKHKTSHKGKQRVLFFNEAAQLILKKYLSADPDEKLLKMRRDNFGHVIQRACERAKVTPFCPYQIRHAVATRIVDEMGAEFAQRLLGHSKAAMTREYSKKAEKHAREAAQHLG